MEDMSQAEDDTSFYGIDCRKPMTKGPAEDNALCSSPGQSLGRSSGSYCQPSLTQSDRCLSQV